MPPANRVGSRCAAFSVRLHQATRCASGSISRAVIGAPVPLHREASICDRRENEPREARDCACRTSGARDGAGHRLPDGRASKGNCFAGTLRMVAQSAMAVVVPHNKQLQRPVERHRGRGASASLHCADAPRITRQRAAAELRRYRAEDSPLRVVSRVYTLRRCGSSGTR